MIHTSRSSRPSFHRIRLCLVLGATALTTTLVPEIALAQSSGASGYDDNVIIVTAQRREQALQDVPMTVTVLNQETLANAGVSSVQDLQNVTSGFSLGRGGSTPQPSIRGITSIINGSYENNVAVYIDGLYVATPQALTIDLPNIENVQILKGPQGTLYGRNATGGAILVETKNPTETWEGQAEATYGRFDDKRIGGVISGPIAEGMGIALSAYTRRRDGYHDKMSRFPGDYPNNPTDGKVYNLSQDMFRAKLRFEFSPTFDVMLGYGYTHTDDHGLTVNFSPYENTVPSFGGGFPGSFSVPTKLGQAAPSLDPGVEVHVHDFFAKANLDLGWATLRSTTGFTDLTQTTRYDFDGTYAEVSFNDSGFKDQTFQQLVDLNMDLGSSLELMVGGQYFNIKTKDGPKDLNYSGTLNGSYLTYDPAAEQPKSAYVLSGQQIYNRTKEAWAVFADATFQATDQLSIIVGGRYSEETQTNTRVAYGNGGSVGGIILFPETTKGSKYKKFTPRASIRYEFSPTTSIYASYSKGFKSGEWPGAFAGLPSEWNDVKQESVDGYEIGLKHASGRLRFDLAGFYMDYKNLQISFTNFINRNGTDVPVVILQNAPRAEIYGAEANLEFEVFDNFNFRAGATYLHARYGDNFLFSGVGVSNNPLIGTATCGNGNPAQQGGCGGLGSNTNADPLKVFRNITNVTQDLSGMQMSRAPDLTAYAGFDYLVPMGDGGLRFAANLKYTDEYVVSNPSIFGGWIASNAIKGYDPALVGNNQAVLLGSGQEGRASEQRFTQKGYVLVNGSITYTDPSDTYYLRVWGNNLTDKKYKLHYNGTANAGSYAVMAEPRTYGVTVGIKFAGKESFEAAPPPPPPPPPPPVEPAPPPPVVCNKGPYIVFFDWDKSDVTPEAGTVLDSAVSAYGNCDRIPIMLAGHTDRSGSTQYNVGLSQRRNGSVRDYLTARGIPDTNISSQAFGESQPRVPTADGVREPQNRRVEITYGPGSGM